MKYWEDKIDEALALFGEGEGPVNYPGLYSESLLTYVDGTTERVLIDNYTSLGIIFKRTKPWDPAGPSMQDTVDLGTAFVPYHRIHSIYEEVYKPEAPRA